MVVLLMIVLSGPVEAPVPISPEKLVRLLGDDKFMVRRRAHMALSKRTEESMPALLIGLKSKDLEVSHRCKRLIL